MALQCEAGATKETKEESMSENVKAGPGVIAPPPLLFGGILVAGMLVNWFHPLEVLNADWHLRLLIVFIPLNIARPSIMRIFFLLLITSMYLF